MDQDWEALTRMRRKNYAVQDPDWIRSLLKKARYGVLATEAAGQPFAYPRLYVYDDNDAADKFGVIFTHGAKAGRTWSNLQANARVCFNVCEMGELLPAKKAGDFNVNFDSVVVFGEMHPVTDDHQAERALYLLIEKYFPQSKPELDYEAITSEELQRTAVYRLEIKAWSGKTHARET